MPHPALQQLAQELGATLPPRLADLSESELGVLTDAVKRLKKQQDADLNKALEGTLSHVPALLRGAVRKILFA